MVREEVITTTGLADSRPNERVARYATWDTLASLVGRWWTRRGIPESRTNLKMAKRLAGFDNPVQLTSATLGFSLTDQYWVRLEGSDLTWELGNFFLNDFDDGIGSILAGITDRPDTPSPVSPSATVDGNLPKMWHVDADGMRVLRKAGSGVLKQEPFNEVVATMLYRRLLLPSEYVAYRRETLGYGQYSICTCFVRSDQEFVSARDIHLSLPGNDTSPTCASLLAAAEALGVTDMAAFIESGVRTVAELAHQPAVDPNNISRVEERAKEIDSLRMRFLANEGTGSLFHVN